MILEDIESNLIEQTKNTDICYIENITHDRSMQSPHLESISMQLLGYLILLMKIWKSIFRKKLPK